jgi:uncharacterized metal-binding protein
MMTMMMKMMMMKIEGEEELRVDFYVCNHHQSMEMLFADFTLSRHASSLSLSPTFALRAAEEKKWHLLQWINLFFCCCLRFCKA